MIRPIYRLACITLRPLQHLACAATVLISLWTSPLAAADVPAGCGKAWWCQPQVTQEKLAKALADLDVWAQDESRKSIYYSTELQPMPMDETLKAFDKSGFNNIYGYGSLHWLLKKSAKFVSLLFPGHFVTVLRVNSNHPYSNPSGSHDAHSKGLDVDMGYVLIDPNDESSQIDFEAQFWFIYMLYSEAKLVSSHRYSGFSYIHEMESYLDSAIARAMIPKHFRFSGITDPWEFSHISHFHFGINPCAKPLTRTASGPRCLP
ncbi:MAG TPA: hypothetical protein VE954_18560 [Oligoflexus sp.]|uniref:hypothetical protein n=1 Tax=Oligoflexus sp. TaxID=1971216 RepID=UPI002D39DB82|nr:hypothetical protein [Oligoflexus sp.]HYX35103.1 hypothetical protein [Oligoflexus sp.]